MKRPLIDRLRDIVLEWVGLLVAAAFVGGITALVLLPVAWPNGWGLHLLWFPLLFPLAAIALYVAAEVSSAVERFVERWWK